MLMLPGGSTIKWGSDQVGINLLEVHPALHLDISHQVGRQDHPIYPIKLGGKIIPYIPPSWDPHWDISHQVAGRQDHPIVVCEI